MRKINKQDVKVGEFVYGIDKKRSEKQRDFRFILKKTSRKNEDGTPIFKVWFLENKSKKTYLFEPDYFGGEVDIGEATFRYYTIRKLNKKEVLEFTKILILKNLE